MANLVPASPLINLCDPVFKTVVTCDTVSSEGYEVTNLLSDDCQKRRTGFLCDRFIKPPVEITLKFPFDVNIQYIQIGAEVGQQKTSGLDVYSSAVPYNSSQCSGSAASQRRANSNLVYSPTAERIGSVVLNDGERGVVIFCPLQYGRHSPSPVPNIKTGFIQRSLVWKNRSVIAHTSSLTVRIFKTFGSSVPAIGSIEIWGGPSSCMAVARVSDIINQWNSAREEQLSNESQVADIPDIPKDSTSIVRHKKPSVTMISDVPEEFLDAITWEIMALPMVLPSGKMVDQQTLDLHAQAESNWGRHPSDPFTGIMFSDGCRPVLDSALKARIDRFLVLNQDRKDLKTVPRTVGRAHPQICHQSVSRFRSNPVCFDSTVANRKRQVSGTSRNVSLEGGASASVSRPQRSTSQAVYSSGQSTLQNLTEQKDQSTATSVQCKKSKLQECATSNTNEPNTSKDDGIVCITLNDNNMLVDDLRSHEKKLDDSLDSALKAVLSGLPSFVNPPLPKIVKECCSCKVSNSLYVLPCTHFLCRPCLVTESKQKTPTCINCKVEFKSSDPVFHHE